MANSSASERIEFVGETPVMETLREDIARAARSDGKVLISGESGSGKEVVAQLIHAQSGRQRMPMVTLNCAGVPDTLLESELFGHTRGSFTGAYRDKPGILEQGHHGTVFLDEIGETSLRMQGMLLRFLETGETQRVGATRTESKLDVRIIAATNRDLQTLIEEKTFRLDLYYRLNVLHLIVPPLRGRRDDIPALVNWFLRRLGAQYHIAAPVPTEEAMRQLVAYDWPGNVRELRNVCERLITRYGSRSIGVDELPGELHEAMASAPAAEEAPRDTEEDLAEMLYGRMVQGHETFWTAVYDPFISRDLTRQTLQAIVAHGLEETRGNYRMLVELFNMPADDYKRFLNVLRTHRCNVSFQRFRGGGTSPDAPRHHRLHNRPALTVIGGRGARW